MKIKIKKTIKIKMKIMKIKIKKMIKIKMKIMKVIKIKKNVKEVIIKC